MKKIAAVLALAISLAGCATVPGRLGDLARAVTTTTQNPVTDVDLYRVKNTYAATLELAVEYRRYCWSAPYAALMNDPAARPICQHRRAVVRAFQKAKGNASAAIRAAQNFIANNPTLNGATAISAAWQAVVDFQSAVPTSK